ncbi:enolase C-terminal domain-like protein [Streptomyces nondiastaticus]|uniref:Enolase C-terminal domain-like protein n=1 Tax=Streptomyces nondiastaticus TaxID=3154512 RepID=A0ABW6TWU3_9ACTN
MDEALLHHAALPMRVSFDHPAARRRRSDSLVLALTSGGVTGLGECAPRPYVTGETTAGVRAELQRVPMARLLERLRTTGGSGSSGGSGGSDSSRSEELLELLRRDGFARTFGITGGNNLICLLETAVLDLLGRRLGRGVGELIRPAGPGPSGDGREPLPVSQVIDLGTGVEEFLATRGPFHFVKVKASADIERDARTVTAIREALGPGVPVMVDANMSWTYDEALGNIKRLADCGAGLIEEPLRKGSWDELRDLRRGTGVPVMLDESLCSLDDARTAVRTGAADAFNIRVAKCGGLLNSVAIIDFAREHGIAFQIGVQVAETGPLIAASRQLAFRHRDAITVEAGQSDRFFERMIVTPAPAVDRAANTISPAEGAGFGMALDDSARAWAVLRHTPDTDRWQPVGGGGESYEG